MPETFSLSLPELDILDEHLRLGRWVHPFRIPYASPTFEARSRQREAVWQALAAADLAASGKLVAEVEETLRAWARPDVLITHVAGVLDDGSRALYRGGWQGDVGFMSRQQGDRVVFDERKPGQVVPEIVDFLPACVPFDGHGVTTTARPGSAGFGQGQGFFDQPMRRYGAIEVSMGNGGCQVGTLLWFDSVRGRFLLETTPLPDGTQRRTFTPTDGRHIAYWLHRMVGFA
ncbi:MAG: hypothetical protein QOI21_1202 [Actinomycetota bacterium]|nr:hypothetical protein [Actinomycetota bacterium]